MMYMAVGLHGTLADFRHKLVDALVFCMAKLLFQLSDFTVADEWCTFCFKLPL